MLFAELSFTIQGSVLLLILFLLIGAGLATLFYRFTLPPLPPFRRWTLSALRAASLCFLLLLFFEPILRVVNRNDQPPIIAVLVDNSQSMMLEDNGKNRGNEVKEYLKSRPMKNIPSSVDLRHYAISANLPKGVIPAIDSLSFRGEVTNLSEAFSQLKTRLASENIQSVVLISDGNFTAGKNPVYDAEGLGIPVYTVGVGDTTEQKDILVEKVVTNAIAYAGTKVPVDVTIKSSGFGGENVEVALKNGVDVLDRKVITLEQGTREYPLRLFAEPAEEGTVKYSVSVSDVAGELTTKNNSSSFYVKVLRSKLRVLILGGAPNADIPAVRQALSEEEHFTVQARIQKSNQEFYEGTVTRALLDSADCFVLVGFPSKATSSQILQELKASIEQAKKPLLFINSKQTDYQKLSILEPLLPFGWAAVNGNEILVSASVSERQKANPLIRLDGAVTPELWQQLPPIYKGQTLFKAKAEGDVPVQVRIQTIALQEPLIASRNLNRMKSFGITGYGIYRWRLLVENGADHSPFLSQLLVNAVRWLTTKDEGKNVRVTATKETYTTAEPVEFTAQVYNEQLRPVDDAAVTVEIQHNGENKQVALTAIGNGLYEGATESMGEGDYRFTGKAVADGRTLGEDKGMFTVGQMNVEFIETKMNKQLLEQIAFRTNGKYYDLANAQDIGSDLNGAVQFSPKEIVQASEIELWNWYYLAGLIVLLLAVEWFMRKQSGMI